MEKQLQKPTMLVVDDERDITEVLAGYFEMQGFFVLKAYTGAQAVDKAQQPLDIILLDVGLPDFDGLEVCARIRDYISCPIVFLTARVEEADKVLAFGAGADDYVTKPFGIAELEARVRAHLRREQRRSEKARVRFDTGLTIDYGRREVLSDGKPIALTRREYEIIALLSTHPGLVYEREQMYEAIWGLDAQGDSTVIVEHIRNARQKLKQAGVNERIETVWGVGYRWAKG